MFMSSLGASGFGSVELEPAFSDYVVHHFVNDFIAYEVHVLEKLFLVSCNNRSFHQAQVTVTRVSGISIILL